MFAKLSKEQFTDILLKMHHTRKFEEQVSLFFALGQVHGTTHLYAGQEATAIGACAVLTVEDKITSTHRGHGHCIGKGIDLSRMMAELLGKESGYCKGKGGSMHIADLSRGNLGANGVVGGGHAIAVGSALAQQMRGEKNITVCFFGDGAANEGSFHEALNLASVWKLPVLFVCENNLYGMSNHVEKSMNIKDISQRAIGYGIPGKNMDGNNIQEVYDTMLDAKNYALENGPMLIVSNTYRYMGHSKSDANAYRSKEEIEYWRTEKDPIEWVNRFLLEHDFTQEELDSIEQQAEKDIEQAVVFAQESDYPKISTLTTDVYS